MGFLAGVLLVVTLVCCGFIFYFRRKVEQQQAVIDSLDVERLKAEEREVSQRINALQRELSTLSEEANIRSFGLYENHYDFPTASHYEATLKKIIAKQKSLIKEGRAAVCHTQWQVGGSVAAGKRMMTNNIKLMLLAFNGECDACISKVRYNNILVMEKRIKKSQESINKMMGGTDYEITSQYTSLKLAELRLVHEFQEAKQREREEQQRIKDEMKEAAQAEREMERALKESEREEARFAKALEQAQQALSKASDSQREEMEAKIAALQAELAQAQAQSIRAKSMAQLTRVGHVYIISNVGSFGDGVYKIGLTRRLDPMDRVKELGDASVPFSFDVHAMIYSQDAPSLENALHKAFDAYRVNRVNRRKEFFRVSLEEIAAHVKTIEPGAEFTEFAVAEEYRKSLAWVPEDHDDSELELPLEFDDELEAAS